MPNEAAIDAILDDSFFLPTANKAAHAELKKAARRLVASYAQNYADDLRRVWETERPFELHLDGITVTGRADVILDHQNGVPTSLALLDYKTSTSGDATATRCSSRCTSTPAGNRREGRMSRAPMCMT